MTAAEQEAWFRGFPVATDDERATFAKGGQIAELAAVSLYAKRTGVSSGPALMYFRWLAQQPKS